MPTLSQLLGARQGANVPQGDIWSTQQDRNNVLTQSENALTRDFQGGQSSLDRELQKLLQTQQLTEQLKRQESQQSYQGGQNSLDRELQRRSLTNQYGIAQLGSGDARYQADQSRIASLANADANRYGSDRASQANMYGSDRSLEAARAAAESNLQQALAAADANRYGSDQSRFASQYGADQSRASAFEAAAANRYGSDQSRLASMYGSDKSLEGQKYSSDISKIIADITSGRQLAGTKYSADTEKAIADLNSLRQLQGVDLSSGRQLEGQKYSSDTGFKTADLTSGRELQSTLARLELEQLLGLGGLQTQRDIAQLQSQTQLGTTGMETAAQRYVADQGLAGTDLSSHRQLEGTDLSSGRQLQGTLASLLQDTAKFREGLDYKRGNVERLFGMLGEDGEGTTFGAPDIQLFSGQGRPLYSPEEMQSMQNDARARGIQQAATATRGIRNSGGARNLGADSAALAEMVLNAELAGRASGDKNALDLMTETTEQNRNAELADKGLSAEIQNRHMQNLVQKYLGELSAKQSQRNALLGAISQFGV